MAVVEIPSIIDTHAREITGLDALETVPEARVSLGRRAWQASWPKLAAIGIALGAWQLVVMSGWKPEFVLPSPVTVLDRLWQELHTVELWKAIGITMQRAVTGFAISVVIGFAVGASVSRSKGLRSAVGALITGLQTMPSIAWFPLAVLLFKLSESAILFVVILGAAPSVANGVIHGIDHIPPLWLRAGKMLGARGLSSYRYVILPAALPSFLGGLKQGWAFAWRSLLAGELIVAIANKKSLGFLLNINRELSDAVGLMAMMLVILILGILVDSLVFGTIDRRIRKRWGLAGR
jgi:NitT/TauT family transport system permease protein